MKIANSNDYTSCDEIAMFRKMYEKTVDRICKKYSSEKFPEDKMDVISFEPLEIVVDNNYVSSMETRPFLSTSVYPKYKLIGRKICTKFNYGRSSKKSVKKHMPVQAKGHIKSSEAEAKYLSPKGREMQRNPTRTSTGKLPHLLTGDEVYRAKKPLLRLAEMMDKICKKYSSEDFPEDKMDVIDLKTLEIVVDNNYVSTMETRPFLSTSVYPEDKFIGVRRSAKKPVKKPIKSLPIQAEGHIKSSEAEAKYLSLKGRGMQRNPTRFSTGKLPHLLTGAEIYDQHAIIEKQSNDMNISASTIMNLPGKIFIKNLDIDEKNINTVDSKILKAKDIFSSCTELHQEKRNTVFSHSDTQYN